MLTHFCPEVAGAYYFGGEGNTGEAIRWGQALGGAVAFMDAYQAHASVAGPHGILITYALLPGRYPGEPHGRRFGDDDPGYSEHALRVLAQPEGSRETCTMRGSAGWSCSTLPAGAGAGAVQRRDRRGAGRALGLPARPRRDARRLHDVAEGRRLDAFGRRDCRRLEPPLHGVKVDRRPLPHAGRARGGWSRPVLRPDGSPVPNLYAGGGTAAAPAATAPAATSPATASSRRWATGCSPARTPRGLSGREGVWDEPEARDGAPTAGLVAGWCELSGGPTGSGR